MFIITGYDGVNITQLLGCFCVFLMYTIPASFMNEANEEFYDALWEYGNEYVMNEKGSIDDRNYYNHLTQYCKEFPLNQVIFGFEVTKKNAAKFVIGFIVSQYVAVVLSDVPL